MDKVAAEKIASEYYNLGISLALQEANLIKTAKSKASGGKKLLETMGLTGLGAGTAALIQKALAKADDARSFVPGGGPKALDLDNKLKLVKDEMYKLMLKEKATAAQSGERLVAEPLRDAFRAIVPNQAGDDLKRLVNTPEGEAMRNILPTKLRGGGAPSDLDVAWSATKDMADQVGNTWARWGTALNDKVDDLTGINPYENVLSGLDQYSKMLDTAKQTGLEDATRTVTEMAPGRAELADLLMR